ncbi:hypothetical protein HDU76_011580, partial [Blyttiomyces sp. JEL0837]
AIDGLKGLRMEFCGGDIIQIFDYLRDSFPLMERVRNFYQKIIHRRRKHFAAAAQQSLRPRLARYILDMSVPNEDIVNPNQVISHREAAKNHLLHPYGRHRLRPYNGNRSRRRHHLAALAGLPGDEPGKRGPMPFQRQFFNPVIHLPTWKPMPILFAGWGFRQMSKPVGPVDHKMLTRQMAIEGATVMMMSEKNTSRKYGMSVANNPGNVQAHLNTTNGSVLTHTCLVHK